MSKYENDDLKDTNENSEEFEVIDAKPETLLGESGSLLSTVSRMDLGSLTSYFVISVLFGMVVPVGLMLLTGVFYYLGIDHALDRMGFDWNVFAVIGIALVVYIVLFVMMALTTIRLIDGVAAFGMLTTFGVWASSMDTKVLIVVSVLWMIVMTLVFPRVIAKMSPDRVYAYYLMRKERKNKTGA